MARRLTASPLPAWVGDLPVYERTLANGLKALVLQRRHAPIVVCDLYYPVGSVDEPPGKTGIAHFVEHMLFKGTDWLPKGHIDRLSFLAAGQSNAETAEDFTHYWFAFPRDRWELALAVESDRMHGARFDPAEFEAERQVIAEERARELDSPIGRLDQTHLAMSYLVHPYRNPIIGWPDDLRRMTVDDLTAFYRARYRPDGAVLVVVGDLDPERALDRIAERFDLCVRGPSHGRGPLPVEPPQAGRRSFRLVEPDAVARGLFGWHTVPVGHAHAPALGVLSDVLTCGRRSRLWDRLVERDRLATWVDAANEDSHLAGQFLIQVEATAGIVPERIEAAIFDVLDELAAHGPTDEELVRSRNRLEAAWRWEQEDLAGLASGLGQVALWGDWRGWQAEHRAALEVTADEIRRAVSAYLVETGLTVGWSLPGSGRTATSEPQPPRGEPAAAPAILTLQHDPGDIPASLRVACGASVLRDYSPRRAVLDNGMRVIWERRPDTGTVALDLFCDAGHLREARPGAAHLCGRLRDEGTTARTAEDIAGAIEDVGGTLDVGSTGVSLRVRAEDLELAIELMADLVLRPAFPGDRLEWARRRIASEIQADRDDPSFRAEKVFRSLVYGAHPSGRDARGTVRDVLALTREDVLAHHDRLYFPDNTFVVAVGDFDPRRLRSLLRQRFGSWRNGGQTLPDLPRPEPPRARARRVFQQGEQVHILLGHLGITRDDPDHDALVLLDHILGSGPGFTDRLSRVIRDELGLAYAVGGSIAESADLTPGLFRVYVGTGPSEARRAVAAVTEQVRAMHAGLFSDAEVEHARQYLVGSWVFDYQTVGQRSERLIELERWGLPLDDPLHWPARIERITAEQVRAAARRHIHPHALTRVEYGPIRRRGR